jgi:hypothetical protein
LRCLAARSTIDQGGGDSNEGLALKEYQWAEERNPTIDQGQGSALDAEG